MHATPFASSASTMPPPADESVLNKMLVTNELCLVVSDVELTGSPRADDGILAFVGEQFELVSHG